MARSRFGNPGAFPLGPRTWALSPTSRSGASFRVGPACYAGGCSFDWTTVDALTDISFGGGVAVSQTPRLIAPDLSARVPGWATCRRGDGRQHDAPTPAGYPRERGDPRPVKDGGQGATEVETWNPIALLDGRSFSRPADCSGGYLGKENATGSLRCTARIDGPPRELTADP
jgi:hypothetical protein